MNKIAYFLIILLALNTVSCESGKTNSFSLEGEIQGVVNTWIKLAKLELSNNKTIIVDSVFSENGEFVFKGKLSNPYLHSLIISETVKFPLFIENSKMTVKGNLSDIQDCQVSGSREDSLFRSYGLDDIFDRKEGMEIMLNKPDYTFSVFVAFYQFQVYNIDIDTMELIVNNFDYPENESIYYSYLSELYETIKNISLSNPAPEFTMKDEDGIEISLSNFRGSYVLLDFWASWCPPCRAANPGLVEVYNEFRNKGFTIVGVSVDEDRDAWIKAIKDDGLEWTNLSSLNGWNIISDLYGVKAIPQNFLLDKDGIILAKNIEKEALVELLSEHL